jgi:hypothetical protein
MITETNTRFTVTVNGNWTSDKPVTHFCKAEFITADSTMAAIVSRIETKIRYLSCYGYTVKGVTVTDAKDTAREIRGMISALECVCYSVTLTNHLLDNLAAARSEALDRLRK